MNDIIKIVQALENSNILLKGATETIKNETKEQKVVQEFDTVLPYFFFCKYFHYCGYHFSFYSN